MCKFHSTNFWPYDKAAIDRRHYTPSSWYIHVLEYFIILKPQWKNYRTKPLASYKASAGDNANSARSKPFALALWGACEHECAPSSAYTHCTDLGLTWSCLRSTPRWSPRWLWAVPSWLPHCACSPRCCSPQHRARQWSLSSCHVRGREGRREKDSTTGFIELGVFT